MPTNLYALLENRPGHPATGEPFYIGMGADKRPYRHLAQSRTKGGHRNLRLHEVLVSHLALGVVPLVKILGVFATKDDAGAAEIAAIAQYGRLNIDPGGTLCNLAGGGQAPDAELLRAGWADPAKREKRTAAMRGKKKTMTPESLAARQINARAPRSEEALAAQKAARERNWDDPGFRAKRSRDQAAAWADAEQRANMLSGRSAGIAQSWTDPATREARATNISAAIESKWANDPEYAARSRAALRAAWADPEKKAARIAKMLESRKRGGAAVQTAAGTANRSAAMTVLNASRTSSERSATQTGTWSDPAVRARRTAALAAAAQDPELKARRLASMLAGKRRKAAERAASVLGLDAGGVEHGDGTDD